MWKGFFVALMALTMLVGCASGPTPEQIASAYYGAPLEQSTAELRTKAWFESELSDPFTAHYKFGKVKQGYMIGGFTDIIYAGYSIDVTVNSKNKYGAYMGWTTYRFILNNTEIIRVAVVTNGAEIQIR